MPDTNETPSAPHLHVTPPEAPGEAEAVAARVAARDRARACFGEIQRVLDEYGCRIATSISAEPVGNDPGRALLATRWGVVPRPVDE